MVDKSSKFDTEECLVFVWSVVTTILSLVGNCAVLVATIKYNAIKIDKISKVNFNTLTNSNSMLSPVKLIHSLVSYH